METTCSHCNRRLRVPDQAAGKPVRCPGCQNVFHLPARYDEGSQPDMAPPVPPGGSPSDAWHLRTEDGADYGPVGKSELDQWVGQGRVTAACQVLQTGGNQWQWAGDVYPQLLEYRSAPPPAGPPVGGDGNANPFADNPYRSVEGSQARFAVAESPWGEPVSDKSKIAAGLLGILLGGWGIHRFYLGFVGIGLLQLLLTIATCGVAGLWGFIEGILLLVGTMDRDADGRLLRD